MFKITHLIIYLNLYQVIPPLGNTTFNVVFLGREEGEIESNLFIHTSEGSFKYQVRILFRTSLVSKNI